MKTFPAPLLRYGLFAIWAGVLHVPFGGPGSAALLSAGVLVFLLLLHAARSLVTSRRGTGTPSLSDRLRTGITGPVRVCLIIAGAAGLLIVPFIFPDYYLDVLILGGIYALLAVGLNVLVGFTGLLNLGFAAFYAIGAYTYALLNTRLGVGFWPSLPLSAVAATMAGLLLAVPALRLRGDYLAIVTLGFGEIVRLVLNNWDSLTNGPNGITGIAGPTLLGFSLGRLQDLYYLVFAFLGLSIVIVRRVKYSRIGRAWLAIRENEIAASCMGIDATRYKVYAFAFGTFWAGLAGTLFAAKMRFVSPESFTFMESVLMISMVILGGIGSVFGAVIGAFVLVILPEVLRDVQTYRMLLVGIGLVVLMLYRPQGLFSGFRNAHSPAQTGMQDLVK